MATNDRHDPVVREAVEARKQVRRALIAAARTAHNTGARADEARLVRNRMIVEANEVLTPREIAGLPHMPSEQHIRELIRKGV